MRRIQFVQICVASAILAAACGSSGTAESASGSLRTQATESTEPPAAIAESAAIDEPPADSELEEPPVDDGDTSVTEEQVDAAILRALRDDVAVRVVEVEDVAEDGSGRFVAEIFGVLGNGGDGVVRLPSLNVVIPPGATITNVPSECETTDFGVTCTADVGLSQGTSGSETESQTFELEYVVGSDTEFPVVFELTATSYENPISNDPDPTNNTATIQVVAN